MYKPLPLTSNPMCCFYTAVCTIQHMKPFLCVCLCWFTWTPSWFAENSTPTGNPETSTREQPCWMCLQIMKLLAVTSRWGCNLTESDPQWVLLVSYDGIIFTLQFARYNTAFWSFLKLFEAVWGWDWCQISNVSLSKWSGSNNLPIIFQSILMSP